MDDIEALAAIDKELASPHLSDEIRGQLLKRRAELEVRTRTRPIQGDLTREYIAEILRDHAVPETTAGLLSARLTQLISEALDAATRAAHTVNRYVAYDRDVYDLHLASEGVVASFTDPAEAVRYAGWRNGPVPTDPDTELASLLRQHEGLIARHRDPHLTPEERVALQNSIRSTMHRIRAYRDEDEDKD